MRAAFPHFRTCKAQATPSCAIHLSPCQRHTTVTATLVEISIHLLYAKLYLSFSLDLSSSVSIVVESETWLAVSPFRAPPQWVPSWSSLGSFGGTNGTRLPYSSSAPLMQIGAKSIISQASIRRAKLSTHAWVITAWFQFPYVAADVGPKLHSVRELEVDSYATLLHRKTRVHNIAGDLR